MPTYIVKYSNINLSQKQKNSIANDITNTHSKFTGANTFFAQVIFQKNQKNSHFMGGKLVKTKEIFLKSNLSFFITIIPIIYQNISVIILSLFVSPLQLGLYYGANRI